MAGDETAQRNWIRSVLGAELPAKTPGPAGNRDNFARQWSAAKSAWIEAVETVDGQISALQAKMKASSDPDFQLIADRGLTALTGNHKTPVMTGIFDVDAAAGEGRGAAAAKLRSAVESFRQHVATDPRIGALDAEARTLFGAEVTIASGISGGLDALARALDAAAG
jgi:hypothetical protein